MHRSFLASPVFLVVSQKKELFTQVKMLASVKYSRQAEKNNKKHMRALLFIFSPALPAQRW